MIRFFRPVVSTAGVDDAFALDALLEGGRQNVLQFGQQRPLHTILLAGGQHGRDAKDAGGFGKCERHALGLIDVDILDELHRANLMVDQQKRRVPWGKCRGHWWPPVLATSSNALSGR
jgi:hypothetical protein